MTDRGGALREWRARCSELPAAWREWRAQGSELLVAWREWQAQGSELPAVWREWRAGLQSPVSSPQSSGIVEGRKSEVPDETLG